MLHVGGEDFWMQTFMLLILDSLMLHCYIWFWFLKANIYTADFTFPLVAFFFWFLMKVDICIDDFKFPYIVLFIIILFMFNNLNWAL